MRPHVVYLHGFASGPGYSSKAAYLREHLADRTGAFLVPDLEGEDFHGLTMDRRRERAREAIAAVPDDGAPVLLVGSSLGAYQAARLAALDGGRIGALLLIAPAFAFVDRWRELLGPAGIEAWEQEGERIFYHYRSDTERPLGRAFLDSCQGLPAIPAGTDLPTVVVHGRGDETADPRHAIAFAERDPAVELHLLDGGHALDEPRHLALIGWCAEDLLDRIGGGRG